jgi:hypothetical protein
MIYTEKLIVTEDDSIKYHLFSKKKCWPQEAQNTQEKLLNIDIVDWLIS